MTTLNLPLGWQRAEVRRFARVRTGKTVASVPSSPDDVEAPYITAAHIQPLGRLVDVDGKVMWFSSQELRELNLRQDDLLVVEGGAGYGRPALLAEDLIGWGFQNHVNRIRPIAHVSPRYLYYVFEHLLTSGATEVASAGATIPTLSAEKVRGLTAAFPPSSEQAIITAFLDRETAQIDAMIEAQRDLVAALAERRSSVLEGALSAVWEYPHRRLQWLYRVSADCNRPDLEVLLVYRDFGVIPKSSRDDNFNKTPENVERYLLVRPDDLVTNRMKAWQGSLGVSKHLGIVSGDYEVARPTTPELLPEFAHFMLRSPRLIGEYRSRSTGIRPAQWRLYWDQMGQIVVPVPPPDVQAAQVHRVKESLSRIDLLVAAANESIVLMQERRSALISSAVTGRIDPRTGKESSPEKVLE